jgi:orotate phosphoribosyltransferase
MTGPPGPVIPDRPEAGAVSAASAAGNVRPTSFLGQRYGSDPMAAASEHSALAERVYAASHLTGTFTLRSGATSNEYFDKYRFEADPRLLRDLADALAPSVPADVDALAGLELGGVPLATLLSQVTGLPARFVRKRAKTYGTCQLAEGGELEGMRLCIVEDVVTSGGAVLDAARELRARGAVLGTVLCVIDRESGGGDQLAEVGLELRALFTMSQLGRSQLGSRDAST